MHVGIAGPIAGVELAPLLNGEGPSLPRGYAGAPLMTVLIGELISRGHRVSAFTLSSDLAPGADVVASGPGLTVHFVPMRVRAWRPNGWRPGRIVDLYRMERHALRRAISAAAPEIVHAHWSYEFAAAALDSGLPHVVTCHDSPRQVWRLEERWGHRAYRALRALMARGVLRRACCITAVSPYLAAEVQPGCRVPVAVVPNPLATRAFGLERAMDPTRTRVLMACTGWSRRKNPQPALRAFARVAAGFVSAELVLLGHGFGPGQEAEVWWRAQGLDGRVRFVGAVSHDEVLDWISVSDALLHPALEESFGVVPAEALAIGLPVIAGRSSGAVPWVTGDAAWLVDPRDPNALAAALQAVLEAGRQPQAQVADRIARGRRAMRERFAVAKVVAAYGDLYHHVRHGTVTRDDGLRGAAASKQD